MKKKKYDITKLLNTGAEYLIPLGKRSNGKSFQVRKVILEDAYKGISDFVYLRRFQADIKQNDVSAWFSDPNFSVEDITNGEYDSVTAFQGFIYFSKYNEETGKVERGRKCGRYCALNDDIRYKSQSFPNTHNIVYEEFITDEVYLPNEPTRLMQFVSTVFRDEKGHVFLIGNTLSRVCPYFYEWGLAGTLRQPQGTIEVYTKHYKDDSGNDVQVRIAVENCSNDGNNSGMFFGNASKQIVSGEWDVKPFPRLPESIDNYDMIYRLSLIYQNFLFGLSLVCGNDGCVYLYIENLEEPFEDCRIIQEDFSSDLLISSALNKHSRAEMKMKECFENNKVCYSDDLTGTDFENVRLQFPVI